MKLKIVQSAKVAAKHDAKELLVKIESMGPLLGPMYFCHFFEWMERFKKAYDQTYQYEKNNIHKKLQPET